MIRRAKILVKNMMLLSIVYIYKLEKVCTFSLKKFTQVWKNVPVSSADAAGARRSDLAGGPPPVVPADEPPPLRSVVFSWRCHVIAALQVQYSKSVQKRRLTHRSSTKLALCCRLKQQSQHQASPLHATVSPSCHQDQKIFQDLMPSLINNPMLRVQDFEGMKKI